MHKELWVALNGLCAPYNAFLGGEVELPALAGSVLVGASLYKIAQYFCSGKVSALWEYRSVAPAVGESTRRVYATELVSSSRQERR
jgi:hypothetical protein